MRQPFIRQLFPLQVLLLMLAGCNWQGITLEEQAKKDIEFMTATIKENHPGPYNTLDPQFMDILKNAYQKAMKQANTIKSMDDYNRVIQQYVDDFHDHHVSINLKQASYQQPLSTYAPQFSLKTITPSICWITLPTFAPDAYRQQQLNDIIAQLPKYRQYDTIIFDLRNNGGGNSTWGTKILAALFGQDYVEEQIKKMRQQAYVEWRASKENIDYISQLMQKNAIIQFGPNSQETESWKNLYKIMLRALSKREPLAREELDNSAQGPQKKALSHKKLCSAKIILFIDQGCFSACLDFIDEIKAVDPSVILVGKTTGADSLYMDVRTVNLPSSHGTLMFPMKVWRNRTRGNNQPYNPDIEYPGDINDSKAFEQWVMKTILPTLIHNH